MAMKEAWVVLAIILAFQCKPVSADLLKVNSAHPNSDDTAAFTEFHTLAETGDCRAQMKVGWMYFTGKGVIQDKSKAIEWYRKAAEQGEVTSQFNLGYSYEHGDGVPQDLDESRIWYKKVTEHSNVIALLDFDRLARIFVNKEAVTSLANRAKARAVKEQIDVGKTAKETNFATATATTVAHMTAVEKKSPPATTDRASHLLPVSASETTSSNQVNAVLTGAKTSGSHLNPRVAKLVLKADTGDADAQVSLGWIYSSGRRVPANMAEAEKWYRRAGNNGNLKAQLALGWLYYSGEGLRRDLKEAAYWYEKAAAQGSAKAGIKLKEIAGQEN